MKEIVRFLNKEVEKEVTNNKELFMAWCLIHCSYDWEIDPLHNPDYVRGRQKSEKEDLESLKKRLQVIHQEYEERKSCNT